MAHKITVKLRQRELPTGNTSLYLDIYSRGKRSYEYLKLYLIPEKTRADKERNSETLKFAETIRAKYMVDLQNSNYGFKSGVAGDTLFYNYFLSIIEKKKAAGKRGYSIWISCLGHLENYDKRLRELTFDDITSRWIQGFKDYLTKARAWAFDERKSKKGAVLSQNSREAYFCKLRACMNKAYRENIINANPMLNIPGFGAEEVTRMYLTFDEIKRLAHTECGSECVKRAFLFSCLTGLRRSDVERLTRNDIQEQDGYTRIVFRQKKTKELEYLDISPQAAAMLGGRNGSDEHIFAKIGSPAWTNDVIAKWVHDAGIRKKITFHCARHSFAVMMLDLGTDIYTVSKLLGHRKLSTTQIYAKVLDKNKQAAVLKIPNINE